MTAQQAQAKATAPVLRHAGPCGDRRRCWRRACRERFGQYRTVEIITKPRLIAIARCHGRVHEGFDFRVEEWASERRAA